MTHDKTCACGSGRTNADCCAPLIAGERAATTAEQLMRSRYSAYVAGAIDYLAQTHDPATTDGFDRAIAGRWAARASWLGLEVIGVEGGGADDERGVVEFIARYRADGQQQSHHERSQFRRLTDGRWVYTEGSSPRPAARARGERVGRNARCPCGSGRKYKRCCGSP